MYNIGSRAAWENVPWYSFLFIFNGTVINCLPVHIKAEDLLYQYVVYAILLHLVYIVTDAVNSADGLADIGCGSMVLPGQVSSADVHIIIHILNPRKDSEEYPAMPPFNKN